MNKVVFIGNLTADPNFAKTPNDVSVCKMTIAVHRTHGEREADFFNIVAWRGLADNCIKYLTKGKKIAVVGSIQNRKYTDKGGQTRYVSEVIADEIEFLTPVELAHPSGGESPKESLISNIGDSDLPF